MAEQSGRPSGITPAMRSVAKGGGALVAVQWSETLVRGLYVLLIARMLGPTDFGIWSYALAIYSFLASLTVMGADLNLTARIGRDGSAAKPSVDASFTLSFAMLAGFCAFLPLYALVLEDAGEVRWALFILVPAVMGRGLALWSRPVFTGFERAGLALAIGAPMRFIELGLGAAILFGGGELEHLLLLHSASWVIEALICFIVIRRNLVRIDLVFEGGRVWAWLRESAPLGLASSTASFLTAGPLILLRYAADDLAQVGQFGLSLQLAMLGGMAVHGMLGAAMPALSRAHARSDERLMRRSMRVVAATGASFVAVAVLAALIGPWVIALIFGERFAIAGQLLPALVLFAGASVLPHIVWQLLVLRGSRWSGVAANLAACLLLVVSLFPAVAAFGVVGAAYAGIAAWLLRAAWLAVSLGRSVSNEDQKST